MYDVYLRWHGSHAAYKVYLGLAYGIMWYRSSQYSKSAGRPDDGDLHLKDGVWVDGSPW